MTPHPFRPRLLDALKGYTGRSFRADVLAGLTVGIVALPLAMAFAIASGLKPQAGLVTAIVAGMLIAGLGGSRVQIGGPAGAFIVVVYGIVQQHGLLNLAIATVLAGVLLIAMGALRLGSLIRYVPVAIVVGFTNGIAVLIMLSQVRDFLGLRIDVMPAEFFAQVGALAAALPTATPVACAIAAVSLALLFLWPALRVPIPGAIFVLVLATLATALLGLPVETIGSRFGGIPTGLPAFEPPIRLDTWSWSGMQGLAGPIITIALLGAIESLLCARVADSFINDRHDPNQELMAQGIANVVSPMFGGMPATGTIARTMTNIRAGARTPVAGIIHALTVLVVMLAAAPLAYHVPLAALAAILIQVAYNMGDWRAFAHLRHYSPHYRTIMLATFILTVVLDLTVAVEIGLLLAGLFFILRVSALTRIEPVSHLADGSAVPDRVAAYKVQGSLFFGSVDKLDALAQATEPQPRAVVLDMHYVMNVDTTALDALRTLRTALTRAGTVLIVCDVQSQARSLFERTGFAAELGAGNMAADLPAALAQAGRLANAQRPLQFAGIAPDG